LQKERELFDRVICIVLDGCGAGPAPDAKDFGDFGENEGNTLFNTWSAVGGIDAPLLWRLGYFAAGGVLQGGKPQIEASWGRLQEVSIGKDTMTGHWEMMGIHLQKPLPTYPNGFPISLIKQFEERIGRQTIGNVAESGTQIIARLGQMHVETGCPIVYTSADSVFQVAAHEDVIALDDLYRICKVARDLLVEPHNVGRVIARPFIGDSDGGFVRTENRKDFPLSPPANLVDKIAEVYSPVFGIGVVPEVFAGRGFKEVERTQSNPEHYEMLLKALASGEKLIFANFEDFDMLYGHRNDPVGFARCLEQFDGFLAQIIARLKETDLLILTADHGNDPTTPSTDHSREYVPISIWHLGMKLGSHIGDHLGLWCVGATIARCFDLPFDKGATLI
jgi:phosphopentomutase